MENSNINEKINTELKNELRILCEQLYRHDGEDVFSVRRFAKIVRDYALCYNVVLLERTSTTWEHRNSIIRMVTTGWNDGRLRTYCKLSRHVYNNQNGILT